MKAKLLLAIFCLIFTINSKAESNDSDTSKAKTTADTLTVYGRQFPIMESEDGARFIQCKKRNGKPYRVPVWEKTGDKYNGHDIYRYKGKDVYFFYGLSKHGYPMYSWLIRQ